jgi:hypothetical protein
MYKWQTVWCILSVDYNQYNYCRLRMVCSPILHSVQKKSGSNSCVILFVGLCTQLQQSNSLRYGKGLLDEEQLADASLSLAATLSHTACVVLRLHRLATTGQKYCCIWRTAQRCTQLKLSEGNIGFWGSEMCGWINRFPEPNRLFTSATLQNKTSVFPKILNLFTRLHVIIFQILYRCFKLYWLLCI